MSKQASPVLRAQLRGERDPPVRRIADHEIETFAFRRLLEAVAHANDRPQPRPGDAAQIDERRIEEHLRHPRRKRIPLEPAQPALNALERDVGAAVLEACRHAPRHRHKERAPTTGRVEHSRRAPVDTRLRSPIRQPLAKCRGRLVRPQSRPDAVRHHARVEHANQVARVPDVQLGDSGSDALRQAGDFFPYRDKPDTGRRFAVRPRATVVGLQFVPVRRDHASYKRPRELQPVFILDRGRQLLRERRSFFDQRPRPVRGEGAPTPRTDPLRLPPRCLRPSRQVSAVRRSGERRSGSCRPSASRRSSISMIA